jgi:hypothetical protein
MQRMSENEPTIARQVPLDRALRDAVLEMARSEERSERRMLAILVREAVAARQARARPMRSGT